eukprot:s620_g19.t2
MVCSHFLAWKWVRLLETALAFACVMSEGSAELSPDAQVSGAAPVVPVVCVAGDGGNRRLLDTVVAKYYKDLTTAQQQVAYFLESNGFPDGDVNVPKGNWRTLTYPLHVAVEQNNAYIVSKLLLFGARPLVKDFWGRTPHGYAQRRPSTHQAIVEVFAKAGCSPTSPIWSCRSKFHSTPPPRGFEEFFAQVAGSARGSGGSPLSGGCEKAWLRELGPKKAQYKKLLDGLHGQRGDIGELKRDLYIARQQAESAGSLEKEVYHLQRELLQERTKVRALSEELENPMNVHRWRKLEGSDPAMYELIQKVRSLQKRLIAKTEEVVVKDIEIQEKDKLHKELNGILEKQPGPEVLEQLEQYQDTYAAKQKQMKAMQSELHTYQSQVSDYKDEIDRLNRELQEVKKKFYDQKKREMIQQDQRCLGGPMGRQSCHSSPTCAAGSLYGRIVQLGTLRSPVSLKSIYEFGRERR